MPVVLRHKGTEVEIGEDITINYKKRCVQLLAQQTERADRAPRLIFFSIFNTEIPAPSVAAEAADQVPQIACCNIYICHATSAQPAM